MLFRLIIMLVLFIIGSFRLRRVVESRPENVDREFIAWLICFIATGALLFSGYINQTK